MTYAFQNGIAKPNFKHLRLDAFDARDYKFSDYFKIDSSKWPKFTRNYRNMPPTFDQGRLGSCSSNALAQLLRFTHNLPEALSRLFIYYLERTLEGTIEVDNGSTLRDGIKALATYGACIESMWPYDISKFTLKPSEECYTSALSQCIQAYYRLDTLDDLKQCLSEGFPVVMGFEVPDSFETEIVAKSGYLPFPTSANQMIGGHAVVASDFGTCRDFMNTVQMNMANVSPDTEVILIANSYGNQWGLSPRILEDGTYDQTHAGYFCMPVTYFQSNLTSDLWTIRI